MPDVLNDQRAGVRITTAGPKIGINHHSGEPNCTHLPNPPIGVIVVLTLSGARAKRLMDDIYQIAAGTVPGRRHVGSGNLLIGKNNQDAYATAIDARCLVACVFDGCSSAEHSEVGAKIAASLVPELIRKAAQQVDYERAELIRDSFWQDIKAEALRRIRNCAAEMAPKDVLDKTIARYFLFTIVGVLITRNSTVFFSVGDGVLFTNGSKHILGPFADNAPPYLCYELIENLERPAVQFVLHELRNDAANEILIATDGLLQLIDNEHRLVPGKTHAVGALSDICQSDRFFQDVPCESLTPWLRQVNSEVVRLSNNNDEPRLQRCYGLLSDDTTIVAIRRRRSQS